MVYCALYYHDYEIGLNSMNQIKYDVYCILVLYLILFVKPDNTKKLFFLQICYQNKLPQQSDKHTHFGSRLELTKTHIN